LEELYKHAKVHQICQGDSVTVILDTLGHVWAAGTFRDDNGIFGFSPTTKQRDTFCKLPLKDIVHVAVGTNHVVACDLAGKVWTWGSGEHGELGRRILHRHRVASSLEPRRLGVRKLFERVYSGAHHAFMVTKGGREVWAWGLNNYGQLYVIRKITNYIKRGTGDLKNITEPVRVEIPQLAGDLSVTVDSCSGGMHHSSILLSNGTLLMFGRNDSFQLGLPQVDTNPFGKDGPFPTPTQVPDIPSVKQVSCGSAFTMAVTVDEDLYAWGFNEMGQLGLEDATIEEAEMVEMRGRKCFSVSCGGQHTLMLVRKRDE
jgi:regulator of chromosome condensation